MLALRYHSNKCLWGPVHKIFSSFIFSTLIPILSYSVTISRSLHNFCLYLLPRSRQDKMQFTASMLKSPIALCLARPDLTAAPSLAFYSLLGRPQPGLLYRKPYVRTIEFLCDPHTRRSQYLLPAFVKPPIRCKPRRSTETSIGIAPTIIFGLLKAFARNRLPKTASQYHAKF